MPGPGCPVCVCPEEDVYQAIQLALHAGVILVAFGDMLRVPVNVPKSEPRSLEQAKAAGADIRPVASPQEAVRIAQENPQRQVVFFVAGFETTTAPVAAMLLEGIPDNLFVAAVVPADLARGRDAAGFRQARLRRADRARPCRDGDGAGGMGLRDRATWHPRRGRGLHAGVAAGGDSIRCCASCSKDECFLDNCYPEVVRPGGNATAQRSSKQAMEVVDANWRGIGIIPASGFALATRIRRARCAQTIHGI